jgi:nucleotide-binding universal stress UspA family protein
MSFKTIMTHVEPDWGSTRALVAAAQLAKTFGAHLVGVGAEDFEPAAYAYADGGIVQLLRDQVDLDRDAAKARFDAVAAEAPNGATWMFRMEYPAQAITRLALGADLVVARRVGPHASSANLCHPADLVTACGAPVLLAPEEGPPLAATRVLVAWRDSPEARRTLTDALPFLKRAETVTLAAVRRSGDADEDMEGLQAVARRLERHGVTARVEVIERTADRVGHELERAADRLDADLIVAGAYSHMRLRERVLGGVTNDLLAACARYILFSH